MGSLIRYNPKNFEMVCVDASGLRACFQMLAFFLYSWDSIFRVIGKLQRLQYALPRLTPCFRLQPGGLSGLPTTPQSPKGTSSSYIDLVP